MPSDKNHAPDSYFRNVLLDGTKPFLYRSGVESLLGISGDISPKPTLSSGSIPVGFTYMSQLLGNNLSPVPYPRTEDQPLSPLHGGGVSSSLNKFSEINQVDAPATEINSDKTNSLESAPGGAPIPQPNECSGDLTSRFKVIPRKSGNLFGDESEKLLDRNQEYSHRIESRKEISEKKGSQKKTEPGSGREDTSINPTEITKEEKPHLKRASLEIPGSSEVKQSFPTLMTPGKSITPLGMETTKKGVVKIDSTKADTVLSSTRKLLLNNGRAIQTDTNSPSINGAENSTVKSLKASGNSYITKKKPQLQQKTRHFSINSESEDDSFNDEPTHVRFQRHGINTVNRSNMNTQNKVDQLRHAVHELASKVSSRQIKIDQENQQHQSVTTQPPQTIEKVVVIRHAAGQVRTPHAFWERSYLGHFHLLNLR